MDALFRLSALTARAGRTNGLLLGRGTGYKQLFVAGIGWAIPRSFRMMQSVTGLPVILSTEITIVGSCLMLSLR
jgi:hypothetical protein